MNPKVALRGQAAYIDECPLLKIGDTGRRLVTKRRDRPYQAGRSRHWVKVEEPQPSRDGSDDRDVSIIVDGVHERFSASSMFNRLWRYWRCLCRGADG